MSHLPQAFATLAIQNYSALLAVDRNLQAKPSLHENLPPAEAAPPGERCEHPPDCCPAQINTAPAA